MRQTIILLIVALIFTFNLFLLKGANAAQLVFNPQLNISEQYSDNIFLSPENQEDDYITNVDLNLTLQLLSRTAGLELVLDPSYNTFADHSDLDFWRYAGRLKLWNNFGRSTRLEITNDYLETENPRDQSENFSPDNPLIGPAISADTNRRGRNRYRTDIAKGLFTHQFGAKDNFYTGLQFDNLEQIDKVEGELLNDYENWQPSLGIEYWFNERWGFAIDGYYSNRNYVDLNDREEYTGSLKIQRAFSRLLTGFIEGHYTRLNFDKPSDDDYQIYEPSLGFAYIFQENAKFTLSVGYYIQDFDGPEKNQESMIVNSEIYKRWDFRTAYFSLIGKSGYDINDQGVQDLGLDIYYQARFEAGYNFTPRLSTSIFGSYRQDEYPNLDPKRRDQTWTTGAGLAYQALQWMNISLNYNYTNFGTDDPSQEFQEYVENSAILKITLQPTVPYRWN